MFKFLKSKKKRKIFVVVITIVFLSIAGFFSYLAISGVKQLVGVEEKDTSRNIEPYNYYLRVNATDYQQELFDELKEICKSEVIDYEQLSASVAKNFVADFYTWSNKKGSYDVGGMCYTNEDLRLNMYQKARDLYYSNLNKYIEEYGSESLPEVELCTTELRRVDEYEMDGVSCPRYQIKVRWTYKEGSVLTDDMQCSLAIYLLLNEGRMEIVEAYESH